MIEPGENNSNRGVTSARSNSSGIRQEAEVADFARAMWRKSSWSSYNGNCVEVAELGGRRIGVRDTKDAGNGPVLVFGEAVWRSFVESVKNAI